MAAERVDWVEIIEPRTREHMYANLISGECVWELPPGVMVKKTDENQWWELFDQKTSRYYYYNPSSQKTVWQAPQNCDIIPLAKLQTLKQNTEVQEDCETVLFKKETVATQTSSKRPSKEEPLTKFPMVCAATQTSPSASPQPRRKHHHHHHHHHRHHRSHKHDSVLQTSTPHHSSLSHQLPTAGVSREEQCTQNHSSQTTSRSQDSGRSSDSGSISQSHSSLESGAYSRLRTKPESECSFDSFESSSSTNKKSNQQESLRKPGGASNEFHHPFSASPAPPVSNPITRKGSFDLSRTSSFSSCRVKNADSPRTYFKTGCLAKEQRSGQNGQSLFLSSPLRSNSVEETPPPPQRRHFSEDLSASQRERLRFLDHSYRPLELGTEKCLINGLCTPGVNRRYISRSGSHSTDSNMSSPHSPIVPHTSDFRGRTSDSSPQSFDSSGQGADSGLVSQGSHISLEGYHSTVPDQVSLLCSSKNSKLNTSTSEKGTKSTCPHGSNENALACYFQKVVFCEPQSSAKSKQSQIPPSENEEPTPLFSNLDYSGLWDYKDDGNSYFFPLQNFLLEEAKLSGYSNFSDSLSQSDEDSDGDLEEDDGTFADDERMSQQDSSSEEGLDEARLITEDDYRTYAEPYSPPFYHQDQPDRRQPVTTQPPSWPEESDKQSSRIYSSISPTRSDSQHALSGLKFNLGYQKSSRSPPLYSPVLEKSQKEIMFGGGHSPLSQASLLTDKRIPAARLTRSLNRQEALLMGNALMSDNKLLPEEDIVKYAEDNLNIHKKGIFRKKYTIRDMLSWSKDPIRKPMIMTTEKSLKQDARELFKLIQVYMGDRKAKTGQTVDRVALDVATKGWCKEALRDELFIQISRQTTNNPHRGSLRQGWELMAICLYFFPPSVKLHPYLESYINRHKEDTTLDILQLKLSHYATVCTKRLERMRQLRAKKGPVCRKPTIEDIEHSRLQIFRISMFGNKLEDVMTLQRRKYPSRRLPWIQTTLSELVLKLNGAQTEGIFRVPGDIDEVNVMKVKMDQWQLVECNDPHVPVSLLKLWYRELYEPLIPHMYYEECIEHCCDPVKAIAILHRLPELNRLVLAYLIRFLQVFAAEENVAVTKMDSNNLAMVMAPNCLRCTSEEPQVIFENARKEMAYLRILIQNLDTNFMEGIV
ncbi:uncharacterized protein LOC143223138 isoform X2 [Tachypleus tridentatus]|uniref:uncharacterized protein LOC143223138 isoform X2 n=3 Tax=Tachypleus tridentatus TaxID=6853 RepID=UPI003FD2EA44